MGWGRSLVGLTIVALCAGCGGGSNDEATDTTSAETTVTTEAPPESTTSSVAATAATTPYDDLDQNGEVDPTCGTREFGAGLVLKLRCEGGYASEPSEGTTLVEGSLAALPSIPDGVKERVLTDVSANAVFGRDPGGLLVVVFFIQSDTLFDVGSANLGDPAKATLTALGRNVSREWPAASVQVRGHTDATGSASANKALSEQRAGNVVTFLAANGIDRSKLSSVGLASTLPLVLEKNPDGSDNPNGRRENRRVELVVRVP